MAIALVSGALFGGAAAAGAAARRTASAYSRFTEASNAWDVMYINYAEDGTAILTPDDLRSLPGVEAVHQVRYEYAALGRGIAFLADATGRLGTEIATARLLDGRWFSPGAVDEAVLSFALAEQQGLSVGDSFEVFPLDALALAETPEERAFVDELLAALPDGRVRVVGIAAMPGQFPPLVDPGVPLMQLAPGFAALPEPSPNSALLVHLADGADVDALDRGIEALAREQGGPALFGEHQRLADDIGRSLRPQVVALAVLSLVLFLAAALVSGQIVARHGDSERTDDVALRAIGLTAADLGKAATLQWTLVAGGAGVVAPVVAFALSPLSPTGLARLAEPDPGLRVDWVVFAAAAVLAMVGVLVMGAVSSTRRASSAGAAARAPFATLAVHPVIGIGVRRAFDRGDRRGRVPVWSTIVGATVGIAAVAAALTVASSLTHQLDDPEQYGQRWNVELAQFSENTLARAAPALLVDDDRVRGAATGVSGAFPMGGVDTSVIAMDPIRGEIRPPLVRGTYPDAADAVALGGRTLEQMGAEIGDEVELDFRDVEGSVATYHVVGEVVMPPQGIGGRMDEGILLSLAGIQRGFASDEPIVDTVFLATAPGVDVDELIDDLVQRVEHEEAPTIDRPTTPSDLVDLGRVRSMPAAFAVAMAVLATAALAHTLFVGTRRRRSDNAVLRAIGFRRRQLFVSVLVQAWTLAIVATVVGVPLGVVLGRQAWRALAESVGSSLPAQVPLAVVVVVLPGVVFALVALLSVVPGRRAVSFAAGRCAPRRVTGAQPLRTPEAT